MIKYNDENTLVDICYSTIFHRPLPYNHIKTYLLKRAPRHQITKCIRCGLRPCPLGNCPIGQLRIHFFRYIKFRTHPCEKLLNANIIGESDGT